MRPSDVVTSRISNAKAPPNQKTQVPDQEDRRREGQAPTVTRTRGLITLLPSKPMSDILLYLNYPVETTSFFPAL